VETGLTVSKVELHVTDAYGELKRLAASGLQFDLILADPPYGEKNVGRRSTSHAQRLLDDTSLPLLLDAEGLFVLGHSKRDQLELPSSWMERRLLRHGDSVIRILSRGTSSP
jgi:16S rRNA G966 N2-methylase RsmD